MTSLFKASAWLGVFAVLVVAWTVTSTVRAQSVEEPALKAAFLYNLAKFAEWPADVVPAMAPIEFCLADAPVADVLEPLVAGRSIQQHPIVVRRIKPDGVVQDLVRGCGVLFASRLDAKRTAQLVATLRGTSVLSVSDYDRFAALGGIMQFYRDGDQVRFAINLGAAGRARLRLSAQLLAVAKLVKDGDDEDQSP